MKKNILFIINPISGGKSKASFTDLADSCLDHNIFTPKYVFSESVGHAHQLAANAVAGDTDIVVAVGGDGTINEVASAVENSGKIMGIIPCGSGNGLARALKIRLDRRSALRRLNELQTVTIDTGSFNDRSFYNMAGIGFDAHISSCFAKISKRGLSGYVKTAISEISRYKPEHYTIDIDGTVVERDAFMVCLANSSQFGNNAHVSPSASLHDGLLDVCIIKPFPLYRFPVMGVHMFAKTAHRSRYVEIIRGKDITIKRAHEGSVHVDGEPLFMGQDIQIKVKPGNLTVIV
ncbi:MAG TPA: diacylglycerol kinase family protein [Sphingobacteriaceae bacterium]